MDLYLDRLLNLPGITIEMCQQAEKNMVLKVGILSENSTCPHCTNSGADINQNNPILIRDFIGLWTTHLLGNPSMAILL